jgi:hypothetical protein
VAVLYTNDAYGLGVYESFLTNVAGIDVTIENVEADRIIRCNNDGTHNEFTKDDVEELLTNFVEDQQKIIVFIGIHFVGAEIAKVAFEKELYGEFYAWIGGMWLNNDMLEFIESDYTSDSGDIFEVLNGAIGLDHRPA